MASVRAAAVAGMFYPADPRSLNAELDELLGGIDAPAPRLGFPKALVVPHAGYIYSGPVAAHAYEELGAARGIVRRVVLLGPVHRVPVRGLVVPTVDAFATPLGNIALDQAALASARELPQAVASDRAHLPEHAPAAKPLRFADEADLLAQLRPGEDGVILEYEGHRATYLPQVWESISDKHQFLRELARKAGLPDSVRLARCKISRYRVTKWTE